jgi:hypothetical protein
MKKLLIAIIAIATTFAPIKKSEAGIIILASTGGTAGIVIGSVVGGIGLFGTTVGVKDFIDAQRGNSLGIGMILLGIPGIILLTLDADGSLSRDQLAADLSHKYTFIHNNSVLENLALLIKKKAGSLAPDEKKEISLTSEEVDMILAPLDLRGYENEVEQMKKDLL